MRVVFAARVPPTAVSPETCESPAGVSHQLYLALIAAVLLQQALGRRPNARMFELLQLYQMGVATLEELLAGLRREADRMDARLAARCKNS